MSFTGPSLVILLAPNVGRVGEGRAQLGTGVLARGMIMELVPVRDGCAWKCGLVGIIIAWELNNSHESVKTHGKSLMQ